MCFYCTVYTPQVSQRGNAPPHRLPIYSQSTVHPSTLNPARRITAPVSRNNHVSTAFPKIHGLASFRGHSFADVAQPQLNRRNSHPQLNREIPQAAARQGYWVPFSDRQILWNGEVGEGCAPLQMRQIGKNAFLRVCV